MEIKIPDMKIRIWFELRYSNIDSILAFWLLIILIANVAPISLKISETVVEVGNPRLLNVFINKTSVTITAVKMTMISKKLNFSAWKTPFLATSIIPPENTAPTKSPKLATAVIIQKGADLEPIAE